MRDVIRTIEQSFSPSSFAGFPSDLDFENLDSENGNPLLWSHMGSISSACLHAAFMCCNALVLNFYSSTYLSLNSFISLNLRYTQLLRSILYAKKSSINLLAQKLLIKWWWNWPQECWVWQKMQLNFIINNYQMNDFISLTIVTYNFNLKLCAWLQICASFVEFVRYLPNAIHQKKKTFNRVPQANVDPWCSYGISRL